MADTRTQSQMPHQEPRTPAWKRYFFPACVVYTGIVSICLILWLNVLREDHHQSMMRSAAAMDAVNALARFHLMFEEHISGDATVDEASMWAAHDEAQALARIELNGGKTHHSLISEALAAGNARNSAEKTLGLLNELKAVALERKALGINAAIGSPLDKKFDALYSEAIRELNVLEKTFIDIEHADMNRLSQIYAAIIAGWLLSIGLLIVFAMRFEINRTCLERARESLVSELNNSLQNIKTLTGLLPICSYCKKIRDDSGYWNKVETYVSKRTHAEFTHGICPTCSEKLTSSPSDGEGRT